MAYRTTRAKGFRPTLKNPQKRTISHSDAVQHRRHWRRRYWWTWPGEIPEKLAPLYWWRCPGCYCFPTDYISFQPSGDLLSDHIRTRCELDLTAETIGLEGWENAALRAIHYDEGTGVWIIAGGAKEEEGLGVTGGVRAAYSRDNGHTWTDISDKFAKTNHKKESDTQAETEEENYDFIHSITSDGVGNWVAVGGYTAAWDDSGARIWYAHNVTDEWKFGTEAGEKDGEEQEGDTSAEGNIEPGYIAGIGSAITAVTFGDGVFISGCGDTVKSSEESASENTETPRGICLVSVDKGETWYFPQENKQNEEEEEESELVSGRFYDIEVSCGYWIGCGYNRVDKSERVCYISNDSGETWYPWTFNGEEWSNKDTEDVEDTEDTEGTEEDEGVYTTYPDELKFRTLTYVEECGVWLAGCEGNSNDYPMGTLWYSDGPEVTEDGTPTIDFVPLINYVPNLATTDILAVSGSQLLPEGAGTVNVCDMQIMAIGYNNPENTEDMEEDTPEAPEDENTGLLYITNSCDTQDGSGDCNSWFFKNENASDFPELHSIRFGARTYLGVGDSGALFRGTPQMSIITDEKSGSVTGTVYSCSNWWVCGRTGNITITPHYGISGQTEVTISWNITGDDDERLTLELCNKDGGKTSIILNYTSQLDYDRPANYLDVNIEAENKDYSVVMSGFSLDIGRLEQAAWRAVYYDKKTDIWLIGGGLGTTSAGAVTGGLAAAMSKDSGQTWEDITDNFPVYDYPKEENSEDSSGSSSSRTSFIHSITSDGNGTYVAVGRNGASSNLAAIWYTQDLGGCWHYGTLKNKNEDEEGGEDDTKKNISDNCQEDENTSDNGNSSKGPLDGAGGSIQFVTYDLITKKFISGTGDNSAYKCLTSSDGKKWEFPEAENETTQTPEGEKEGGEPEINDHGARFFQIVCVDPKELESEESEGSEESEESENPKSLWVACGYSSESKSGDHAHEAHDDSYWSEDEGKTWTPWAFSEPRPKPDAENTDGSGDIQYVQWRSIVWVPRCKLFLAAGEGKDTAGKIWMSKDGKTWCHMKGVTGETRHTCLLNIPDEQLTVAIGYASSTASTDDNEDDKDPCEEGGGGRSGDGETYTLFGCPTSGDTEGEEGSEENKCVCPENYSGEENSDDSSPSCQEWIKTDSGDLYRLYWVEYGNGVYIGAGNCGSLFIGSVALTIFTGNSSDCATGTVDSGSNWYVCETHLQNEGDKLQLTPRAGGCDETDVELCWSFKESEGDSNNPQRSWIRICNNGGNSTYITVVYTPESDSSEETK
ncbi:MAG: hypothetical protein LUJ25_09200 [Firmicutes bacterium]|nr:hypothetical protein [Bacillota bacterium]